MKRYNKSDVMKSAWVLFRTQDKTFSECLKESWYIAKNENDCDTFEKIYAKYSKEIYRYVIFKVRHVEIAKELTQDIFLKINKSYDRYNVARSKLKTWIYVIVNNTIIDYYRTNHGNQYVNVSTFADPETGKETYQFVAPQSYETESVIVNNELKERINTAFQSLKPAYRHIAQLYFLDSKQYNEIAQICNIPLGTVKGMINRCRTMLQNQLQNIYTD